MNKILLLLIVFGFTYLYSNVEQPDDDISFNLIVENCNSCHGWDANGIEGLYSIKKLSYEEFIQSLLYYKKNDSNSVMKRILEVFLYEDIIRLADFYYKDKENE